MFKQITNPKRVFSNRLGISYQVDYIANLNPKQQNQKRFLRVQESPFKTGGQER